MFAHVDPNPVAASPQRRPDCQHSTIVFPSTAGTWRDPNNFGREWRRVRDELGVPDVTTHSFRKSVATLIDDRGLSARVGADHLGHSKVSMTHDVYMARGKVHTQVADVLDDAINDAQTARRNGRGLENMLRGAPSGFRTPDPLIKRGRFWLLPAVSGCVPYSTGRQCFAYLITFCRIWSIPVDCVSFAPHKRHLALSALANLLQSLLTEHFGPKAS
jgi:Phage integrase family